MQISYIILRFKDIINKKKKQTLRSSNDTTVANTRRNRFWIH